MYEVRCIVKYNVYIKNIQNPIIFLATSFKSGKVALPLNFFSLLALESRWKSGGELPVKKHILALST